MIDNVEEADLVSVKLPLGVLCYATLNQKLGTF